MEGSPAKRRKCFNDDRSTCQGLVLKHLTSLAKQQWQLQYFHFTFIFYNANGTRKKILYSFHFRILSTSFPHPFHILSIQFPYSFQAFSYSFHIVSILFQKFPPIFIQFPYCFKVSNHFHIVSILFKKFQPIFIHFPYSCLNPNTVQFITALIELYL